MKEIQKKQHEMNHIIVITRIYRSELILFVERTFESTIASYMTFDIYKQSSLPRYLVAISTSLSV